MQYSFRLAELLNHVPDARKRPGTIKSIVEYTGLDRHQVAALLKNEVKYIPLKALSRLCDYLVEHGHATADQLPGALFAVQPEHFWELLARRQRLELCLGVRQSEDDAWPAWVVASDSILMGEVLNGVSTLGGTAAHTSASKVPQPDTMKQSLVWSPGQVDIEECIRRANLVYEEFINLGNDKAMVCLGSTKSNPVVELIIANVFDAKPFEKHIPKQASSRKCPFFIRYRDQDPHPDSCWGGLKLSEDIPSNGPGIYYRTDSGKWEFCPSGGNRDAAFVFYANREAQGRLEMAIGGFSGRATRLLARALTTRSDGFWPPLSTGHGLDVGAFVVQFDITGAAEEDMLKTDFRANTQITPISPGVLEKSL